MRMFVPQQARVDHAIGAMLFAAREVLCNHGHVSVTIVDDAGDAVRLLWDMEHEGRRWHAQWTYPMRELAQRCFGISEEVRRITRQWLEEWRQATGVKIGS